MTIKQAVMEGLSLRGGKAGQLVDEVVQLDLFFRESKACVQTSHLGVNRESRLRQTSACCSSFASSAISAKWRYASGWKGLSPIASKVQFHASKCRPLASSSCASNKLPMATAPTTVSCVPFSVSEWVISVVGSTDCSGGNAFRLSEAISL